MDAHATRPPDSFPAYLRFLSHDMMPAMRERMDLLQPLRADAAALLALLAADPEVGVGGSGGQGKIADRMGLLCAEVCWGGGLLAAASWELLGMLGGCAPQTLLMQLGQGSLVVGPLAMLACAPLVPPSLTAAATVCLKCKPHWLLLTPAALLQTRQQVAWCEGQLVTAVTLGPVPAKEPGISALLSRFAAQGAGGGGASGGLDAGADPQPMEGLQPQPQQQFP